MNQPFWDDMYSSREQVFSGLPNDVLISETDELPRGQALDVGCGEGADARWLAERGWQVTAIDVSLVALERAAPTHPDVSWSHADLQQTPPPRRSFDLVSAHYFPIERENDHPTIRGLLDAVAPGGTLLFVGHDPADFPPNREHGHNSEQQTTPRAEGHDSSGAHKRDFDPHDCYLPGEVAELLDHDWVVVINGKRPRTRPGPPGTTHMNDLILRAHRKTVSSAS